MNAPAAYDPNSLSMTPTAVRHVKRQLEREGASALMLAITESGCNGYMYELKYLDDDAADVRTFDFDGVTVLVTEEDWSIVRGTQIDYVTEGLNATLKFNNPNATGECGCGESFSVQ